MELRLTPIRPLHGIPVLLKNNIATADKMNNTGRTISGWNSPL
jgi:Asp-tRNA(Asn)/Glu-tRNA(Gln) amidotransferase A subunit family amidase